MAKRFRKDGKPVNITGAKDMPPMAASMGLMTQNKTGSWRSVRPVIDYEKCISCMVCWKFCPEPAIKIKDEKPVVDYEFCKGCMICEEECPVNAINMEEEEGK